MVVPKNSLTKVNKSVGGGGSKDETKHDNRKKGKIGNRREIRLIFVFYEVRTYDISIRFCAFRPFPRGARRSRAVSTKENILQAFYKYDSCEYD